MNDKERLMQWMQDNQISMEALAAATSDTYSTIHMITKGNRQVNQAFKWRFQEAFGYEEARKVFSGNPHMQAEVA